MSRPVQNDVFPQVATFEVQESAANTTTSARITMPIARIPNQTRVQVIEITKVEVEFSESCNATGENVFTSLSFRDFGSTEATYSNPSCFFKWKEVNTIVTSGNIHFDFTKSWDFTTGGGRGYLIATDSIFAQIGSASLSTAAVARYKLWYRFVQVGLQEYVGIVQQQSSLT